MAGIYSRFRHFGTDSFKEGWCPGSRATNFVNVDSYATVPNMNITDCDFTIACWMKVPSRRDTRVRNPILFSSISASGNPLILSLKKFLILGDVSLVLSQIFLPLNYTKSVIGSRGISFNEWTHVAVKCHGNSIKMFVNGIKEKTHWKNISYPVTDGYSANITHDLYKSCFIGKDPRKEFYSSGKFYGSVMDLHVIGVALSEDEISDLFNGEICLFCLLFCA